MSRYWVLILFHVWVATIGFAPKVFAFVFVAGLIGLIGFIVVLLIADGVSAFIDEVF